jgi:exosortase/archaeosortase family protein
VILMIESWALAGCFGPMDRTGRERWRAGFYGTSWMVTRPTIVVATATLLIAMAWSRRQPRPSVAIGQGRRVWCSGVPHVVGVAGFAVLTSLLRDDTRGPSPQAGIAMVAWAATGLSALGFWGAVAWTDSPLGRWAWYVSVGLTAGSAAGIAAAAIGSVSTSLWYPLSRSTLWAVHGLLRPLYPDLVYLPADLVVRTGSFGVRVEPECSGFEGIGLILTFLAGYLWFARHDYRFPRSLLLLPLGAAAMWLANAVRIALLVSLGTSVSPDVAERGFHSHAGWLALISVGLGFILTTRRMWLFTRDNLDAGGDQDSESHRRIPGPPDDDSSRFSPRGGPQ